MDRLSKLAGKQKTSISPTLPPPSTGDEIQSSDPEAYVRLWRGTTTDIANKIATFQTAGGVKEKYEEINAPSEEETRSQVGGSMVRSPKLPEYTTNTAIAKSFCPRRRNRVRADKEALSQKWKRYGGRMGCGSKRARSGCVPSARRSRHAP